MGWWGKHSDGSLSSIKKAIEDDLIGTGTRPDGTVVSYEVLEHTFRFGESYIALARTLRNEENSVTEVFAIVTLWRYSKKNSELMLKAMDETMEPCYHNATAKLLRSLSPTTNNTAHNWRVDCWKKFKRIPLEYKDYR